MSLPRAHSRFIAAVGCFLYDQRYRGRFHTLTTIGSLFNKLSPCGMVINRHTAKNAFSISGRGFYAEFDIYSTLNDVLNCPEGTILAVRRVHRADSSKGYFTVVGCFDRKSIPGEEVARQLDRGNTTASARHVESIQLPQRVQSALESYIKTKGKSYFVGEGDVMPTPAKKLKRRRTPGRPGTANSSSSSAKKRGRPGSANQQILLTPRPPTPKSKREIVADLKASLDVDVKRQKRLELAIEKDVKKIKGLAALEKKVLAADALNEKIQSNLEELNRLDTSQSYHVANGIPFTKLHYYVNESHAVMIDLVNDRRIIFRAELDKGIMNKTKPPPPPPPPPSNVTDSDATPVVNDANAVDINADPTIAIDMESDADSTGSNRQKRRRRPKKKSKNQRARLVFDKTNNCWVPKWLMLMGSRQNSINKDMVEAVGKLRNMFEGWCASVCFG
eukprot:scaffold10917_cov68-Cyclotella_meneghiniana.AAC.2